MSWLSITRYSPFTFGFFSLRHALRVRLLACLVFHPLPQAQQRDGDQDHDSNRRVYYFRQFGDIYLQAASIGGASLNKALVPNLAFTIAIGLYITLKSYEHKDFGVSKA